MNDLYMTKETERMMVCLVVIMCPNLSAELNYMSCQILHKQLPIQVAYKFSFDSHVQEDLGL